MKSYEKLSLEQANDKFEKYKAVCCKCKYFEGVVYHTDINERFSYDLPKICVKNSKFRVDSISGVVRTEDAECAKHNINGCCKDYVYNDPMSKRRKPKLKLTENGEIVKND